MRLLWIATGVVLLDQTTKVVVRLKMATPPYRSISLLGDWLKFTFTENPGMAFGITFGPAGMVTAFSIAATLLIIVYLYRVRKEYAPYRFSLALILGGAVGNIIDRMFYGMLFDYGSFFQGRVVDFIHINLWSGYIPDTVPLIGGTYMALFPIWNVADMAIVIGVVGILVFQKKFHKMLAEAAEKAPEAQATATVDPLVNGEAPPGTAETPLPWTPPGIAETPPASTPPAIGEDESSA